MADPVSGSAAHCPNCRKPVARRGEHYDGGLLADYTCDKETQMTETIRPEDVPTGVYTDTYPLDSNGYVVVSRPFIRLRADEVLPDDLLILDSGLSRVTAVRRYTLDNGVAVVHITGPTNVVRADYEVVTVLR